MHQRLKRYASIAYGMGMLCAVLLYTHHTYGHANLIKVLFYLGGALGLLLSLLQFRFPSDNPDDEFNLLYWIGSLVIYLGFALQMIGVNYSQYLLLLGLLVTGASFFINPFKDKGEKDEDLLDN